MSGWSQLGASLGGLQDSQNKAYQLGALQGARTGDLLEQAVERRNKNLAMQAITPQAMAQTQVDPISGQPYQADVQSQLQGQQAAALLRAGLDPRLLSGYQGQEQKIGFNQSAMGEALKPNADLNLLNRQMIVIGGKPVDLSTVRDGVSYNQQVTPDQNTFTPTDVGQALIGADNARAGAANAAAGNSGASAVEHQARTRLINTQNAAGGWNPKSGAGGNEKPTLPPQGDMAAVLGAEYDKTTGVTRVPPEKMQQFLAWQAQKTQTDPRYNNGAFALRQYAAEAPLGSGIRDKPSDVVPSSMQMVLGGAPIPSNPGPAAGKMSMSVRPIHETVPAAKRAPAKGTMDSGYIFNGGDPADPKNWIKASSVLPQ